MKDSCWCSSTRRSGLNKLSFPKICCYKIQTKWGVQFVGPHHANQCASKAQKNGCNIVQLITFPVAIFESVETSLDHCWMVRSHIFFFNLSHNKTFRFTQTYSNCFYFYPLSCSPPAESHHNHGSTMFQQYIFEIQYLFDHNDPIKDFYGRLSMEKFWISKLNTYSHRQSSCHSMIANLLSSLLYFLVVGHWCACIRGQDLAPVKVGPWR